VTIITKIAPKREGQVERAKRIEMEMGEVLLKISNAEEIIRSAESSLPRLRAKLGQLMDEYRQIIEEVRTCHAG
jgi:archaellum component FlaC